MNALKFILVSCLCGSLAACTAGSTSNSSVASDIPDFWLPFVVSTTPASNAVNVPVASSIAVTFSETVNPATVNASTFIVSGITGTVSYSGATATFTPDAPFTPGAAYTATVTTGVSDFANNRMGADYSWSFTATSDVTPPTVLSTAPADAAAFVSTNASITATFSEPIDWSTITAANFIVNNGSAPIAGALSYSSDTIIFSPSTSLTANTVYTATITTGVRDLAGNALASNYSWSFGTNALFMSYVSIPSGPPSEAVAIGDINSDGRNDVVMTTSTGGGAATDNKLFVYLQNTTGGLDVPVIYSASGTASPLTAAIGDMNHDGKNDVVIGSGLGIEVFTQNVSAALDPGVTYTSIDSNKIRIADLNNDGWLDVVGIGGGASASIWLQNAGGTLDAPVAYAVISGGDLDVGDINNDGLNDIVIMSGQNIGVLAQTAGGIFSAPAYYGAGTNVLISGVAVGDINGDNLNDIVVTHGGNKPDSKVGVFTQNPSGTLDPIADYASYDIPGAVEVADVTGDARKDIITLHNGWGTIGVHQQLANGSLGTEILNAIPYASWYNTHGLAIGDINGDGKNDAVVASITGLTVLYHY